MNGSAFDVLVLPTCLAVLIGLGVGFILFRLTQCVDALSSRTTAGLTHGCTTGVRSPKSERLLGSSRESR